jgi:hypothetical protein
MRVGECAAVTSTGVLFVTSDMDVAPPSSFIGPRAMMNDKSNSKSGMKIKNTAKSDRSWVEPSNHIEQNKKKKTSNRLSD